jgi:hypothetical protein
MGLTLAMLKGVSRLREHSWNSTYYRSYVLRANGATVRPSLTLSFASFFRRRSNHGQMSAARRPAETRWQPVDPDRSIGRWQYHRLIGSDVVVFGSYGPGPV